jgi:uroporphyrinogen decarboxylase
MTKRAIVQSVLEGKRPPYVPWSFSFTQEAHATLCEHWRTADLDELLHNHLLGLGDPIGFFEDIGNHRVRDVFGAVWDRSIDKDIGVLEGQVLPEATLKGYSFPDPLEPRFFADFPSMLSRYGDRFRVYQIGFCLYERAWTLRGMESLMMDFLDHPDFVDELLNTLVDYNIAQINQALRWDIDAIYFGDDWGQQQGLQMGPKLWRRFLKSPLQRMYRVVRDAGKYVFIHSCGDVDELFEDLIEMGVNCFNPFQPEVMNIEHLLQQYRGRLVFHGGLSTQRTLPFGNPEDVRIETRKLLELGQAGGYLLSPAHAVEGDVPLDNMLAFIEEAQAQPGFTH